MNVKSSYFGLINVDSRLNALYSTHTNTNTNTTNTNTTNTNTTTKNTNTTDTRDTTLASTDTDTTRDDTTEKVPEIKGEIRKEEIRKEEIRKEEIRKEIVVKKISKNKKKKLMKAELKISSEKLENKSDLNNISSEKLENKSNNKSMQGLPTKQKVKDEKTRKQRIEELIEKNNRTIFIGNLPVSVIEKPGKKLLKSHLEQFGTLESIRFRSIAFDDPMPKKNAFLARKLHEKRDSLNAYAVYTTPESSIAALVLNSTLFLSHHLRVDFTEIKKQKKIIPSASVFIGNLPFDLSDESLWAFFEAIGEIETVRCIRDTKCNVGKGFGYIQFKDPATVSLALKLHDSLFLGRRIRILPCSSTSSSSSSSSTIKSRNNINNNESRYFKSARSGSGPAAQSDSNKSAKFGSNKLAQSGSNKSGPAAQSDSNKSGPSRMSHQEGARSSRSTHNLRVINSNSKTPKEGVIKKIKVKHEKRRAALALNSQAITRLGVDAVGSDGINTLKNGGIEGRLISGVVGNKDIVVDGYAGDAIKNDIGIGNSGKREVGNSIEGREARNSSGARVGRNFSGARVVRSSSIGKVRNSSGDGVVKKVKKDGFVKKVKPKHEKRKAAQALSMLESSA